MICLFLSISCNFHFQMFQYTCVLLFDLKLNDSINNNFLSILSFCGPFCTAASWQWEASSSPVWVDRCYRAWRQTSGAQEKLREPQLLERNQVHLEIEIHFAKFDTANHTKGLRCITVFDRNYIHFTNIVDLH